MCLGFSKLPKLLLILILLTSASCGSRVYKTLDPYYGDPPCREGVEGIKCNTSLEEEYKLSVERSRKKTSSVNSTLQSVESKSVLNNLSSDNNDSKTKNTLVGAIAGGVVGGGLTYAITEDPGLTILGAGIGAIGGGLLGNKLTKTENQKYYKLLVSQLELYKKCITEQRNKLQKARGKNTSDDPSIYEVCAPILANFTPGLWGVYSDAVRSYFQTLKNQTNKKSESSTVFRSLAGMASQRRIFPLRTMPKVGTILITPWKDPKKDILHQGEIVWIVLDYGEWLTPERSSAGSPNRWKILSPVSNFYNEEKKDGEIN